jgi:hypothetical protein
MGVDSPSPVVGEMTLHAPERSGAMGEVERSVA